MYNIFNFLNLPNLDTLISNSYILVFKFLLWKHELNIRLGGFVLYLAFCTFFYLIVAVEKRAFCVQHFISCYLWWVYLVYSKNLILNIQPIIIQTRIKKKNFKHQTNIGKKCSGWFWLGIVIWICCVVNYAFLFYIFLVFGMLLNNEHASEF